MAGLAQTFVEQGLEPAADILTQYFLSKGKEKRQRKNKIGDFRLKTVLDLAKAGKVDMIGPVQDFIRTGNAKSLRNAGEMLNAAKEEDAQRQTDTDRYEFLVRSGQIGAGQQLGESLGFQESGELAQRPQDAALAAQREQQANIAQAKAGLERQLIGERINLIKEQVKKYAGGMGKPGDKDRLYEMITTQDKMLGDSERKIIDQIKSGEDFGDSSLDHLVEIRTKRKQMQRLGETIIGMRRQTRGVFTEDEQRKAEFILQQQGIQPTPEDIAELLTKHADQIRNMTIGEAQAR